MKPPEKAKPLLGGRGRREDLNDGRGYAACHHGATLTEPLSQDGFDIKTHATEECLAGKTHYKAIATFFKHGGFSYRQIAREGDVAIYEQTWRESENLCYEVVRIRRHEAKTFPDGKSSPAREAYPPSAAWGADGFTFTDRDAAFAKLRALRTGR